MKTTYPCIRVEVTGLDGPVICLNTSGPKPPQMQITVSGALVINNDTGGIASFNQGAWKTAVYGHIVVADSEKLKPEHGALVQMPYAVKGEMLVGMPMTPGSEKN